MHTAMREEWLLGHVGAECVGGQRVLSPQQFEIIREDWEVKNPLLGTHTVNCNATADPNRLGRGLRPAIGSDQAPERFEIADQNRRLAEIYQALAMPVLKNFVDAFPAASGHVAELSLGDVKFHRCALQRVRADALGKLQ